MITRVLFPLSAVLPKAWIRPKQFASLSSRVSILENADLLEQIPLQDVRNWCFIAHIDHGKSVRHLLVLLFELDHVPLSQTRYDITESR